MVKNIIEFKPKEKILKYLIENKKPVSIRETSSATMMDYKNVYGYVGDLSASGAIVQKALGNITPIEINLAPHQEIFSVEQKRTKEFLELNKPLKLIQTDINEVGYPFFIVLIFGSYAKRENTKKSDVDICIISDNQEKTKELISKLSLLPLKLEIHDFNIKEFESMLETKKENLAKEIIKYNIILYGIENYYNLISRWMKKE